MIVEWKVSSRECKDDAVLSKNRELIKYRVNTQIFVRTLGRNYEFRHWFVSVGSADSMAIGSGDQEGGGGFVDMEDVFREVLHLNSNALWSEIIEEARGQASELADKFVERVIAEREMGRLKSEIKGIEEATQYNTFIRGKVKFRDMAVGFKKWC